MGQSISFEEKLKQKVQDIMIPGQLQAIRQAKNQRDAQLSIAVASTKDRVYWMAGTLTFIVNESNLGDVEGFDSFTKKNTSLDEYPAYYCDFGDCLSSRHGVGQQIK